MATQTPITFRALAAALGVNPGTAHKWKARGMPTHSVEAAQAWRDQHAGARVKPGGDADADTGEGGTFTKWRTRRERAEAQMAEIAHRKARGELIAVDAVRDVFGREFASIRDALLRLPARMGPVLAAETDPAAVERVLYAEIHAALVALAAAPAKLQPGDAATA